MANVNRPSGLSPIDTFSSSSFNAQTRLYRIPAADTNQYYVGDVVASLAGGDINGVPNIIKATGAQTLRGVVVGIITDPTNLNVTTIPAVKLRDYYVNICDDPDLLFDVTDDGNAGWSAATAINKNCSLTIAVPSTPNTGVSATVLSFATLGTSAALNIKILGTRYLIGDTTAAPFARWVVKINQHEFQGATAGV